MTTLALAERPIAGPGGSSGDPQAEDVRVLVFLFTDIEGSAALTERLGDSGMYRLLIEHHGIIRGEIRAAGGREAGTAGDGFMVVFEEPGAAVRCAVGIQRAFARRNASTSRVPIRVRIGVHAGPAIGDHRQFCGR
ncbi:MAG: adenylate/guanylate cyclase domain-containing protein, partial [Chloroflexi bacterium]|nr:adenylate/guanylate cyclase domain-containing protein [Chloroflexota bacterium]